MRGERLGRLIDAVVNGRLARCHRGSILQLGGFFQSQVGITSRVGGVGDRNHIEHTACRHRESGGMGVFHRVLRNGICVEKASAARIVGVHIHKVYGVRRSGLGTELENPHGVVALTVALIQVGLTVEDYPYGMSDQFSLTLSATLVADYEGGGANGHIRQLTDGRQGTVHHQFKFAILVVRHQLIAVFRENEVEAQSGIDGVGVAGGNPVQMPDSRTVGSSHGVKFGAAGTLGSHKRERVRSG